MVDMLVAAANEDCHVQFCLINYGHKFFAFFLTMVKKTKNRRWHGLTWLMMIFYR